MTLVSRFRIRNLPRAFAARSCVVKVEVGMRSIRLPVQRKYSNCTRDQEYFEQSIISDLKRQILDNKWPNTKTILALEKRLVLLQEGICRLSSINRNDEALALVERYMFNIAIRIIAIMEVKKKNGKTPGVDKKKLITSEDCIEIVKKSKWTNFNKWSKMEILFIKIVTPFRKTRGLGIISTLDRVLQTAFVLLMDPYYEAKLPQDWYGFRKGRSALQALGYLKAILERACKQKVGILSVDMEKYFDNLNPVVIVKQFEHPLKFRKLLWRWLTPVIKEDCTNIILNRQEKGGLILGSVLRPLICNVLLAKNINEEVLFQGFCKTIMTEVSSESDIYRYIITYVDDIIIITTNQLELEDIKQRLDEKLSKIGVKLSEDKTKIIRYNIPGVKIKFNYLGFTFYYIPVDKIRVGGLLKQKGVLTIRKKSAEQKGTILVYPMNKNFEKMKRELQVILKELPRKDFRTILNKLNSKVRGYVSYFYWSNSYNRFRILNEFIFRNIKKYLIRKYRFRGIRRPVWVAETFLITTRSPVGLRWHPHFKLSQSKEVFKRQKSIVWLKYPTKVVKILPITVVILSKSLRNKPYYINKEEYQESWQKVRMRRLISLNYKEF